MVGPLLVTGVASALAVVFVVAVGTKFRRGGLEDLRLNVGTLWPGRGRLPPRLQRILAVGLVGVEAVLACSMTLVTVSVVVNGSVSRLYVLPFAAASVLLGSFVVAHAVAVKRGVSARCACFGRGTSRTGTLGLARATVLLALSGGAGLAAAIGSRGSGGVPLLASATVVVAGAVVSWVMVALDEFIELFHAGPRAPTIARRGPWMV